MLAIDTTELRARQLDDILHSRVYLQALDSIAAQLADEAPTTPNEKTIETRFDQYLTLLFEQLFAPLGHNYLPEKELAVDTVYARTKGRADTAVGDVVIEFKHPSRLSSDQERADAIAQVLGYVDGFNKGQIEKTLALVTDGINVAVCSLNNGVIEETDYQPLTRVQLDQMVRALIGVGQKAMTAANLVRDFADNRQSPTRSLAVGLADILTNSSASKTSMLLAEWKHLFQLSHMDVSQQVPMLQRRAALSEYFDITIDTPDAEYLALFALQTSYAIVIKLLAFKAISQAKYDDTLIRFVELANADSNALRMHMERLESGDIIRDYGVQNLLEGDYFSWYTAQDQWAPVIATHIRKIATTLDGYQTRTAFRVGSHVQDFFKELYYHIVPAPVRHALGEYYTPSWLAARTIDRALELLPDNRQWRALDPTCGSGTFLTQLIDKVVVEEPSRSDDDLLHAITGRVVGIDINPLAVLTARVNYFLNIAKYIGPDTQVEVPVYTGDSAYSPQEVQIDDVPFLEYTIDTEQGPFVMRFPSSCLADLAMFSKVMSDIELDIKAGDRDAIVERIAGLLTADVRNETVTREIRNLADTFLFFEKNQWDGIWARVFANYLATAKVGLFDLVVGNPPWVDWKNLPSNYRERIKALGITDTLFSGDGLAGGINLNIAALITNTCASTWLAEDGVLAMLMPDTFLQQRTYEGYRNLILHDGTRGHLIALDDWTKAGAPFWPVTQCFMGYFISRRPSDLFMGIPVAAFVKKRGQAVTVEHLDISEAFDQINKVAIRPNHNPNRTNIVVCDPDRRDDMVLIGSGTSDYLGREGMRFFPLELLVQRLTDSRQAQSTLVELENIQNPRSQHHVPRQRRLIEKSALRPLVRSTDIKPFRVEWTDLFVPFPFDPTFSSREVLPERDLRQRWPKLYAFFMDNRSVLEAQSSFTRRMVMSEKPPFYAIARAGDYSFAPWFVASRANSKSVAAVVGQIETPWGLCAPAFQDHAITISVRPDGTFISESEADYIAGVMNSRVVSDYVAVAADRRSIPVTPRYRIPVFGNPHVADIQEGIAEQAHEARVSWHSNDAVDEHTKAIDDLYITMLRRLAKMH